MLIEKYTIAEHNDSQAPSQKRAFEYLAGEIKNVEDIIAKLMAFQVAIPSWALGTGGTRFGRFPGGGETANRGLPPGG